MTRKDILDSVDAAMAMCHCEPDYECPHEGLDEVSDEFDAACRVIESLKRGDCWCDQVGHSAACIEAQRFLENAQ